jgi:hypothetical protein
VQLYTYPGEPSAGLLSTWEVGVDFLQDGGSMEVVAPWEPETLEDREGKSTLRSSAHAPGLSRLPHTTNYGRHQFIEQKHRPAGRSQGVH